MVVKFILNNGYNFVRFNFKYHQDGNSIDNFNLESDLEDIQSLIKYLDLNGFYIKDIGIIGKSFGGVKGFLLNDSRIKVYGFISPATFFGEYSNIDNIKTLKYGEIKNIKDIMLDENILYKWRYPTIFIHGEMDEVINMSNSKCIFNNIKGEKEIYEIKGMKHNIDLIFHNIIGNKIILFFSKFI